jgi:ADP-ribose pyrophosphatase YjhB (NUDIX family)
MTPNRSLAPVSLAGAIIRHPQLGLLLQLRDADAPTYLHHWGLFGGHMEEGESPDVAVWRELQEELQLTPQMVEEWRLGHESPLPSAGRMYIYYMTTTATLDDLVLGEGEAMRYVQIADLHPPQPYLGHPFTAATVQALQIYLESYATSNTTS